MADRELFIRLLRIEVPPLARPLPAFPLVAILRTFTLRIKPARVMTTTLWASLSQAQDVFLLKSTIDKVGLFRPYLFLLLRCFFLRFSR